MTLDDILAFCNFNSTPDNELANSEVIISVNGERKKKTYDYLQKQAIILEKKNLVL